MPQREEWTRLQQTLSKHGYLANKHIRDVVSDQAVSSELASAINAAQAGSGIHGRLRDRIEVDRIEDYVGIVDAFEGRFCGVPDAGGSIGPLTFGSPGGRWRKGALTYSLNTAGCNFVNAPGAAVNPAAVIAGAFAQWQAASKYFIFTQVPINSGEDIRVVFDNGTLDSRFGRRGGVLASAGYPEQGNLRFDASEAWSLGGIAGTQNLLAVALHEMGHLLGLTHSNAPNGTMYPYQTAAVTIDAESQNAVQSMYGWQPQIPLPDRATSDRVALGVTSTANFTTRFETLHMVWKGVDGDSGLYESELGGGGWSPQRRIGGVGSTQSPALAPIGVAAAVPTTGLLMAWTGAPGDSGLYWSRNAGAGWEPQQNVPGVGSSTRPALASVNGTVVMAWKGSGDDSGIYWSTFDGVAAWSPQANVAGVGTTDSPALVAQGSRLFMFWKGVEGDSSAYWSVYDFVNDPIWRPQRRIEYFAYQTGGGVPVSIGTSGALSATTRGNRILLAWKGVEGDSAIWISYLENGEFSGQFALPNAGTSVGPGVADMSGQTYMAWKGVHGDSGIYWSSL